MVTIKKIPSEIKKIQSVTKTTKIITLKLASYTAEMEVINGNFNHLHIGNDDHTFYFSTVSGANRFIDLIDGVHNLLMDFQNKKGG